MRAKKPSHPDLYKRFSRLLSETARKPSPNHVHQLRTTARRLESAMGCESISSKGPIEKFQKQLAKVRKRAGHVRDLDVQLAALEKLNIGRDENSKEDLASELSSLRKKQTQKLLKLLGSKGRSRIHKRLRQAQRTVKTTSVGRQRQYEARAKAALANLLASAQQAFSPETLHEFRLAAKRTRYLFELAPEGSASKKAIEQLRAVQDSVGEWHDWLTLTTNARKRLSAHSALLSALENTTRAKFADAVGTAKRIILELREHGRAPERKRPSSAPAETAAQEALSASA